MPCKTEAPAVAAAQGFGDQAKQDDDHSARLRAERKALNTLRARFALKGFQLEQKPDGTLAAHRWGLMRDLPNFHHAEEFLAQIGGAQ